MPTQSIPSTLLVDFSSPQNLDDEALAAWLDQRYRAGCAVGYLHADYVCKVVDLDSLASPLHPADPEKKSKTLLKKLARGGLLKQLVLPQDTLNTVDTVDSGWRWIPVTQDEILILLNSRQMMLGREAGRGAAISTKTAQKVWADAGGRCMYEGCGEDLTSIALHTKPTRVGYLAHIIASDPSGPRGSLDDSHRLSNNADNIMLMCDAHHRLIDSFAPIDHPADRLFAMRQKHRDLVRFYLNALAYPRSRAVTLHANLAHVPTHFHESELIDAILATGRAMLPDVVHYIRRYQRDDRRTPDFWYHYLQEHELEIHQLVNSFNTSSTDNLEELAVFPLHHIATMVLAGRIVGEARATRVFQYHRHRRTWQWDTNESAQPAGTFNVKGLTDRRAESVFITIELTAQLDEEAVPENLTEAIAKDQMPWIRITTPTPDSACIRHPDDLDQFMSIARRTINHVQDVMRAHSVHLIAISPASTVFCFGQMLQAGHHPTYTIYDRASRDTPFGEAFSISGHEVTASADSRIITIPIR